METSTKTDLKSKIVEVLKTCYDPEIPVDIYELGLIYDIDVDDNNKAYIKMTLTSPMCPVAGTLPGEVENKIKAIPEISDAVVELVWDPPWNMQMMSEAARLELGFM
jgi:FeS assembly SUF system protein